MIMNWKSFLLIVVQLAHVLLVSAMHESYNFALPPAARSCFYEDFEEATPVKLIDIFVESGGSLDVILTVHGPLTLEQVRLENYEEYIFHDKVDALKAIGSETSTYTAELKPSDSGTYAICVDNRSAHFLTKNIQLDVRTNKRPEPVAVHIGGEATNSLTMSSSDENIAEAAVIRIRESMERVRKGIKKIQVQQQVDRHRLQLHQATNVLDNNKVVTGSVVETTFFIAAAFFQIFFVRRWFANRNGAQTNTKANISV